MIQGHVAEASQVDPSHWGDWGDYAVKLIGAGGVGLLLREVVKQVFARANKGDDNAALARADLRRQVADLIVRVDTLTERLDAARDRADLMIVQHAELRAENVQLRDRYHRVLSYVQTLILRLDHYADRLGIPDEDRPNMPPWVAETVPGPTERAAPPRAPDTTP